MRNDRLLLWNTIAICEIFKISCLMEEDLMRHDWEIHLQDRSYDSEHCLNSRFHQFEKTVLSGIFLGYVLISVGIWGKKETLRGGKHWTRQKSILEGSKHKKSWRTKKWKFHIPILRCNSIITTKRSWSRSIHIKTASTCSEWSQRWTSGNLGEVSPDRIQRWRANPRACIVEDAYESTRKRFEFAFPETRGSHRVRRIQSNTSLQFDQ